MLHRLVFLTDPKAKQNKTRNLLLLLGSAAITAFCIDLNEISVRHLRVGNTIPERRGYTHAERVVCVVTVNARQQ